MDGLRGLRPEGEGVADSLPWLRLRRGLESGPGGVVAVGNALEDEDAVVGEAADLTGGGCSYGGGGLGPTGAGCGGCECGELQHLAAGESHEVTIRHFWGEMQLDLRICGKDAKAYPGAKAPLSFAMGLC